MKRSLFRRALALGLCLLALAPALTARVRAEGAYISFSDPAASPEEALTVAVRASIPLSRISLRLRYDESALRYDGVEGGLGSAAVTVSGDTISIEDYAQADGDFALKLHFTALKLGKTELRVVSCSLSLADGSTPETAWGYASVNIVTEESDTALRALSLQQATLSPTFSPDVLEYRATVPESVRWVAVTARPNSALSTALVAGHETLQPGENPVTVTVTARDGSQQVYTIIVTRDAVLPEATPAPTPEPSPEPVPVSTPEAAGTPLTVTAPDGSVLEIGAFTYLQVPAGFTIIELSYRERSVAAIERAGRAAVYLPGNDANPAGFYYLDAETGAATPIDGFRVAGQSYQLLDAALSSMAPAGAYALSEYDFGGVSCRVFVPEDAQAQYVVFYGRALGGRQGLYLYDTAGGGVVRYGLVPEETEVESEVQEAIPYTQPTLLTADEAVLRAQAQAAAMRRAAELVSVAAAVLFFAALSLAWALLRRRREHK